MGGTTYSNSRRMSKSSTLDYMASDLSSHLGTVFKQNISRKIHESMDPKQALMRESRYSAAHPKVIPVIVGLDVTGSMGDIPVLFVQNGLPTLMTTLIDKGVDTSVLFLGIGDHVFDSAPLQVGQFESGDEELDIWLTRLFVEKGGGHNQGESYLLAWDFANRCVKTDYWEKDKKKGYIFTIGDEPSLPLVSQSSLKEIYGEDCARIDDVSLISSLTEKYHIYHFNILNRSGSRELVKNYWKDILGQNAINIEDYKTIPNLIADIIFNNEVGAVFEPTPTTASSWGDEIML